MKIGDYVETPRFLMVKISEVYESPLAAWEDGYRESAHYNEGLYGVFGKSVGENKMVFAAVKRS